MMKSVISGGRCGSGIIGGYGGLGQKRGFGIPAHPKFYHGVSSSLAQHTPNSQN